MISLMTIAVGSTPTWTETVVIADCNVPSVAR